MGNRSKLKTQVNDADVRRFIESIDNEQRRNDAFALLDIFTEITGEQAKMWGSSIIGFGSYHYKSKRSRQEGDWMLTGFSPRKQNLSLYCMLGFDELKNELKKLGPHKTSVSCLYIKRLSDVDVLVLKNIIQSSYLAMKTAYISDES